MIVEAALDTMEITDLANRQVGELSGDQQQRVMPARTLAQGLPWGMIPFIFHTLERLNGVRKANFQVLLWKCSANTKKGRPGNDSVR